MAKNKKAKAFLLAASISLATAFTLSCSEGSGGNSNIGAEISSSSLNSTWPSSSSDGGFQGSSSSSGGGVSSSSSGDSEIPEPETVGTLSFTNADYTDKNGKKYYWLGTMPHAEQDLYVINKASAKCEDYIYVNLPENWDINSPGAINICAEAVCNEQLKTLECAEAEFVPEPSLSGTCEWADESPVAPGEIVPIAGFSIQNNYGRCEENLVLSLDGKTIWAPPSWKAETANRPVIQPIEGIKAYAKCSENLVGGIACPDMAKKIKNPKATDYIVDDRDGQVYQIVKIGTQIWMAENLSYYVEGSKYNENNDNNGVIFGRFYDWSMASRGICPKGWHIPSNVEWDKLYRYADGTIGTSSPYSSSTAGKHLKAASGWNNYGNASSNGTDQYGFSALPGGNGSSDGGFDDVGYYGYWWSASEYNSNGAYGRSMDFSSENAIRNTFSKSGLLSVRCLQD